MSDNFQKNFTQILDEFKSGDKSKAFNKQENYFMLMAMPPEKTEEKVNIGKEIIFVIDISGSMQGVSISQAKKGLQYSISQLNNNDLFNRIAELTDSLESKDYFKDPDYKFLVNENHRLEQQYLEVMADNKKLAAQIEDKMDQLRKSGM